MFVNDFGELVITDLPDVDPEDGPWNPGWSRYCVTNSLIESRGAFGELTWFSSSDVGRLVAWIY